MHNSVVFSIFTELFTPSLRSILECFHHPKKKLPSHKHHLPSPPFPQALANTNPFLSFWLFLLGGTSRPVGSCNTHDGLCPSAFTQCMAFRVLLRCGVCRGSLPFCWQRGCGLGIWNVPKLGTRDPYLGALRAGA